jgi:hypothetical protein
MSEAEWLKCDDPQVMLSFLQETGRAGDRKLRLFGLACCRRIWTWLTSDLSRQAVEAAEQFADEDMTRLRLLKKIKVLKAWDSAGADYRALLSDPGRFALDFSAWAATRTRDPNEQSAERAAQAVLLRDIFGNPFRPRPPLAPSVQTRDIVALAQRAYDDRKLPEGTLDAALCPTVGDALEPAGCTDAELLGHLRSNGEAVHVRGCWAVDMLLGKA